MNNTIVKDKYWWREYNKSRKDYIKMKNDERAEKKRIQHLIQSDTTNIINTNETDNNTTIKIQHKKKIQPTNYITNQKYEFLCSEINQVKLLVKKVLSENTLFHYEVSEYLKSQPINSIPLKNTSSSPQKIAETRETIREEKRNKNGLSKEGQALLKSKLESFVGARIFKNREYLLFYKKTYRSLPEIKEKERLRDKLRREKKR